MSKGLLAMLGVIAAGVVLSVWAYPQMPDEMPSHWNAQGQSDDTMPKWAALSLMPIVSLVMLLLFTVLPNLDPMKENIEKFRNYYVGFVIAVMLFLLYMHAIMIMWGLGARFDFVAAIAPAIGGLFYCVGVVTSKAKRNWFIGFRTPWTMSSDAVWDKTHSLGGKLFKASGIIAALGAFAGEWAFPIVLFPVLASALYTSAYSYFEYKKEIAKKPGAKPVKKPAGKKR